jgi:uncharacterized membrane protein
MVLEVDVTPVNKIVAFLSYLLLVPGWLFVLIFRRKHPTELIHARQSLVINAVPIFFLLLWYVFTWLVITIPLMGPLVAWFAFAILIAIGIFILTSWIVGMVRALRGNMKPLPIIGTWAAKIPF